MMKTFLSLIKAFIPPIVLFLFHVVMIFFVDIYTFWPDFDILMHFAGGFTMGVTAVWLINFSQKENSMRINHPVISIFLTVCFVALMATLWEFAEWTSDHYLATYMQAGLDDTMFDMFLGVCGGLLSGSILTFKNTSEKK